MGNTQGLPTISSKLKRIADLAKENPTMQFTAIFHLMDIAHLRESFRQLRKDAAPGISGQTAEDYAENLEENLTDLHRRIKAMQYKAPPVKRQWIDKDDGKKRGLGIPEIEDKIVQKAMAMLLDPIYEQDFYECSYGFRKGRNQHQALKELRGNISRKNTGWIIDADISGFFDNINHEHMRDFIRQRVNDGRVIRLIGKWLNAGVLEGKELTYPESGTPQGGVISPLLANMFLHYVLDEWFEETIKLRLKGKSFLVRYADDFIIGFESEDDALRVMKVLPKRFNRYGLTIHPVKTKLVDFRRPNSKKDVSKGAGTIDFLGFTHYWAKTRKGNWIVKRKTAKKKLNRSMKAVWTWCRDNRHITIREQWNHLNSKLRGHYQYYGVRSNYKSLEVYYEYLLKAWKQWLGRRSRDGFISYAKLNKMLEKYPLVLPRIVHYNV
jgi:RNA-directed DNA polymerase